MNVQEDKVSKTKPIRCVVVSDKMSKSRIGKVERLVKHPVVGKFIKKSTRIMFHDEGNTSKLGDQVLIIPRKPKSTNKAYELLNLVEKG